MRVAIVHDYLTQRGGAERVVLSLHRLFPDAPVYTSVYDPEGTYEEFGSVDVRPSFLQRLPHRANAARALLPLYALAFDGMRVEDYDVVISSSSGFAHAVRVGDAVHLCYCYTPPRWLYGRERYLARGGPVPRWAVPAVSPLLAALRRWDQRASRRPDLYVAVSKAVAARIEVVYGRRAPVVYPPVGPGPFSAPVPSPRGTAAPPTEPYYLVVARLLPYKRVELAAEACASRGRRLVVVGDGPARPRLERLAGPLVELRSGVSDAELAALVQGARALIQAGEEDFGLVPLEANAAGRPVVAYAAGGALETVTDGVSGVLFHDPSAESLASALDRLEASDWDPQALRAHAAAFSEARFHRSLTALIDDLLARRDRRASLGEPARAATRRAGLPTPRASSRAEVASVLPAREREREADGCHPERRQGKQVPGVDAVLDHMPDVQPEGDLVGRPEVGRREQSEDERSEEHAGAPTAQRA